MTNSRRFEWLAQVLRRDEPAVELTTKARKPWTDLRSVTAGIDPRGILVVGDQSVTDGRLAARLGVTFVHFVWARRPSRCGGGFSEKRAGTSGLGMAAA